MSEQNAHEATDEPVVEQSPTTQAQPTTAPFDGEFDPQRARQTIDHLRDREKELERAAREYEQQAREYERLNNDPAALAAFLAERGYEIDDGTGVDEYEGLDASEVALARIERVEQELAQRDAAAQAEAQAYAAREILDAELAEMGVSQQVGDQILAFAIHALPRRPDGLPDVQAAQQAYQSALQEERQKWLESEEGQKFLVQQQQEWMRSKKAPAFSPNGMEGAPVLNTDGMTPEQARQARVERAMQRLQDAQT